MRSRVCFGFLGLALAAVLSAVPVRGADVDKLLPDDTDVIISINLRQILESGVAKKHALQDLEKGFKSNPEAQKVLDQLGLDPMKDIFSVTLATSGTGGQNGLAIVHGSFDPAKIHAAADGVAKAHPEILKFQKENNTRVYEIKDASQPLPYFAALLNKEVLVIAPSRANIIDAVGKSAGKKEPKLAKNLQELINKLDGKQSLWVAALASQDLKKQLAQNETTKDFANQLQSLSGGVTLTDDVKIDLRLATSDPIAARGIREKMEGLKALATLLVTTNEQLKEYQQLVLEIVNCFRFSQDRGTVAIEIRFSSELIDKGARKAKKLPKL